MSFIIIILGLVVAFFIVFGSGDKKTKQAAANSGYEQTRNAAKQEALKVVQLIEDAYKIYTGQYQLPNWLTGKICNVVHFYNFRQNEPNFELEAGWVPYEVCLLCKPLLTDLERSKYEFRQVVGGWDYFRDRNLCSDVLDQSGHAPKTRWHLLKPEVIALLKQRHPTWTVYDDGGTVRINF